MAHEFEAWNKRGIALANFGIAFKDGVNFGISHARSRADNAFDNLVTFDAASWVELHDAAQHQAVFAGSQAADVARELLREHWNGAIGKVDAGAAQARFEIEICSRTHIFGHVCNMYLQLIAAFCALVDEDSIVKVAGCFAVDGDDRKHAKIVAAVGFGLVEMGHTAGFGQHVFSEDSRQLVFANHHFDVHAKVVGRAQHLDDTAHWRTCGRGPTGDFDINHEPFEVVVHSGGRGFGAQHAMRRRSLAGGGYFLAGGNEDGLGHALVKRDDVVAHCPI